jgi:hypothetical protein
MERLTNNKHGNVRSVRFDEESVLKMWSRLADLEDKLESGQLVEVVRCKDCMHRRDSCDTCWRDDDFCSYGAAKEPGK